MRLCFSSICDVLKEFITPPTKIKIGRILMEFIDGAYCWGIDDEYLLLFVNRSRNLPAKLLTKKIDMDTLVKNFELFIEDELNSEHVAVLQSLALMIGDESSLPQPEKDRLLLAAKTLSFSEFLAELFQFTIKNTKNKDATGKSPDSNNDHYRKGWLAVNNRDLISLEKVFNAVTDQEILARLLEDIATNEDCMDTEEFIDFFHQKYTLLTNNVYRLRVFVNCLTDGYFMYHPSELISRHLSEFTNQVYIRKAFGFLIRHNWQEQDVPSDSESRTEQVEFGIISQDEINTAFDKLTNQAEIAQLLEDVAKDEKCMKQQEVNLLFHDIYTRMTNNVYKLKVLESCIATEYFRENPEEIIERHLSEFTNEIYISRALVFLYLNGFQKQAQSFKNLLTNKKYIRQFEQAIMT